MIIDQPEEADLPHRDWICEHCHASNSHLDAECQYCDDDVASAADRIAASLGDKHEADIVRPYDISHASHFS